MVRNIDWAEFKTYRTSSTKEQDNFMMLLDFLKSYYNMFSVLDIYDTLRADDTAKMMLDKRDIKTPEALESFLFQVI